MTLCVGPAITNAGPILCAPMNNSQPHQSQHPYSPDNPPYLHIGEAKGTRALVDAFYDNIRDTSPRLKDMHPDDDTESREKLYLFLSGWLGGPPLYIQTHGHPRLRMRHMPFPIDQHAANEWIRCMTNAIDQQNITDPLRTFLLERFTHTANFMINQHQ